MDSFWLVYTVVTVIWLAFLFYGLLLDRRDGINTIDDINSMSSKDKLLLLLLIIVMLVPVVNAILFVISIAFLLFGDEDKGNN